jgi:hypothetical protein
VPPAFSHKAVAPGEGKTVLLFGVRFSYKIVSADRMRTPAGRRCRGRR